MAADLILNGSMPSYRLVSFHAQQAAEKFTLILGGHTTFSA
ncbi:MAG: hypothetical protein HY726_13000 [Candidatus Rokubacteria bacterium]|nr:hypothetical protein [Candidatus Rokubacteria bacterium]